MWTTIVGIVSAFIYSFTTERLCFMLFAFLAHDFPLVTYQLVCGYFRSEGLFEEYLIQSSTQNEIPPSLLAKTARHLMIGHLVLQWIPLYFFYDVFVYLGVPPLFSVVSWRQLLLFVPFMILCDTLLYWSHRTLHHPLLYTRFHKQHHEFKSNVPFASEYFTLTEEIFTGFIPTLAGPLIFRPHPIIIFLWIAFRVCESCDAHCGYDFPYSPFRLGRPGDRHDFHHSHNMGNFSAFFCFWDRICGTDEAYKKYKIRQADRNRSNTPSL